MDKFKFCKYKHDYFSGGINNNFSLMMCVSEIVIGLTLQI